MFKKEKCSVEKHFQFLLDKGFELKKYFCPPDEEYIFTKNNFIIEIHYYLGVQLDGNNCMCFSIVTSLNGDRRNILDSYNIFEQDLLQSLANAISNSTIQQQIFLYAEFLKKNIN